MRSIPQPLRHNYIWIVTLLVIVGSSIHLNFTPMTIADNLGNSLVILEELLDMDWSVADTVFYAIIETVEMALIGSSIGFAISIPIALLASKNIFPIYISAIFRGIISMLWAVPPLLWALLLVSVAGLGPTAGILAITAFAIGLSGKYLYEIFESQNPSAYDVVKSIGVGRLQIIKYVTIPEATAYINNQFLFILSYNIRESAILGLVGAGGIGFYLMHYLESLQYGKASPFIIGIIATILAMDYLSTKLRSKTVFQ